MRREYELLKARRDAAKPEYLVETGIRAQKRMARFDALPADVRAVANEYGLEIVEDFWNHGVRKGKSIAYLIDCARNVLRTPDGGTTQKYRPNVTANGKKNHVSKTVTVPIEPTDEMIAASMSTVSGHNVLVTKREKHRLRLKAAISAGAIR